MSSVDAYRRVCWRDRLRFATALLALSACGDDGASVASDDDELPEVDASTHGNDAGSHAQHVPDAGSSTVQTTPSHDAGTSHVSDDAGDCTLGEASSFATDDALSLFGDVVYFAKGQDLPAGRYRVTYVDGCMKYNFLQAWRVNQDTGSGPDGWWLVGANTSDRVVLLPGDAQSFVAGAANFSDCVSNNKMLAPKEFDFAGGKLGIWLNDAPYIDNLSGENGDNPRWQLTLLATMCPPNLVLL